MLSALSLDVVPDLCDVMMFLLFNTMHRTSLKIRVQVLFRTLLMPAIVVYLLRMKILREMFFRISLVVNGKPPPGGMVGFSVSKHLRQDTASSTRAFTRAWGRPITLGTKSGYPTFSSQSHRAITRRDCVTSRWSLNIRKHKTSRSILWKRRSSFVVMGDMYIGDRKRKGVGGAIEING